MQEFPKIILTPASPQGHGHLNYPPSAQGGNYNVVSPQSQQFNNNYNAPVSPQGHYSHQNVPREEIVSSRRNQQYDNYSVVSPGQHFNNNNVSQPQGQAYGQYSPLSRREQPPNNFTLSPQNSDGKHYPSPTASPGSWNVPSPQNVNATSEGYNNSVVQSRHSSPEISPGSWNMASSPKSPSLETYSNPFASAVPSHADSPVGAFDSPNRLIRRGYEGIPALPVRKPTTATTTTAANTTTNRVPVRDSMMMHSARRSLPPGCLEGMATSSRQKKVKKEVPNHQTINAYKYKLDFDREKNAKSKALDLMHMFL